MTDAAGPLAPDPDAAHDAPADPPAPDTPATTSATAPDPVIEAARGRRAAIAAHRRLLAECGLFDPDWYRRHLPAARGSDLDPLDHYLARGIAARAAPGPLFDPDAYLTHAWHLHPGQDDPLTHFLAHGMSEGRQSLSRPDLAVPDPLARPVEPWRGLPATTARPSIAVVAHVFYVELFDEICAALALLPYRFTLLVTTDTADKAEHVRHLVARHGLDAALGIHVGPNRGRNFGPLLCGWRAAVAEHDLLLHLHTKKSLYRGAERSAWRQAMLRTLLPATAVLNGLIQRFLDDPALGVLTACPGEEVRYWAYNWLSSRHLAQPLFDRLGLRTPVPRGMFDYPVGGMFWARTAALRPLLDQPWTLEDFPPELGQTDGTLMHAIERVIVPMAAALGYGFAELDYERGLIRPGWSLRNLDQYRRATPEALLDSIDHADTVSFDVFDTLLTRLCLTPDAVPRFLALQVARRHPGTDDYRRRRQAAETAARADRGGEGDVDLDEIHARFRRDAGPAWTQAAIDFVQREEVELDRRLLRPRAIMLAAMRHASRQGRRIVLTSDSYLPRRTFDQLLSSFAIADLADETYLSSERRARKDRGDLWHLVAAREQNGDGQGLLHVGDNEQSDIQQTADHGIRHFHVLSPQALMALHGLDPNSDPGPDGERPLGDEILLGPIAASLFNSPYLDPARPGPVRLDQPERAGAVLFGPLLFAFVAWLARHPTVPHLGRLHFVSREGWFLKRLYDAVRDAAGRADLPPSHYFHSSRRAALAALQGQGLDPDAVLVGAGFNGPLSDLLEARLGFIADPALGHHRAIVSLPRDNDLVRCMMELMRAPIEAHGREALAAFTAYARSTGITDPKPLGFVDVGYSGTIQSALQRTLGRPLIGLYMGVSHAAAQVRQGGGQGGGHAFGAFADGDIAGFTGGYGLMLEAFLTAPHGQVTGYDTATTPPTPRYRREGASQRRFAMLERLYAGVEDYALTLIRAWGPEVLDVPFRPEAATAMLQAVRDGRLALSPELMSLLSVEDDFCGNGEIAVFSLLRPPPKPARP